jgi:hypothetical protein
MAISQRQYVEQHRPIRLRAKYASIAGGLGEGVWLDQPSGNATNHFPAYEAKHNQTTYNDSTIKYFQESREPIAIEKFR